MKDFWGLKFAILSYFGFQIFPGMFLCREILAGITVEFKL